MESFSSGHHRDLAGFFLYGEMFLIQGQICTQLCVARTADSVLIREVCPLFRVSFKRGSTVYSYLQLYYCRAIDVSFFPQAQYGCLG